MRTWSSTARTPKRTAPFCRRCSASTPFDAGGGWLIFALPPAEAAVHPAGAPTAELYLMCDDLEAEIRTLAGRGVECSAVEEARWGSITKMRLPGGTEVGLYQPKHPLAIERSR